MRLVSPALKFGVLIFSLSPLTYNNPGASHLDCAMQFYKAMKVYPQPQDLLQIYDSAVPKDVLEVLAEVIALDSTMNLGGSFTKSAASSTSASDEAFAPVE